MPRRTTPSPSTLRSHYEEAERGLDCEGDLDQRDEARARYRAAAGQLAATLAGSWALSALGTEGL